MSAFEKAKAAAAARFPYPDVVQAERPMDIMHVKGEIDEKRRIYAEGWVSRPAGVYTDHLEQILDLLQKTVISANTEFTRAQVHMLLVDFVKTFLPNADNHIPGLIEKQADEFMQGVPVLEIERSRMFSREELREHLLRMLVACNSNKFDVNKELVDNYLKICRL